jgi:hypothetical protein
MTHGAAGISLPAAKNYLSLPIVSLRNATDFPSVRHTEFVAIS